MVPLGRAHTDTRIRETIRKDRAATMNAQREGKARDGWVRIALRARTHEMRPPCVLFASREQHVILEKRCSIHVSHAENPAGYRMTMIVTAG